MSVEPQLITEQQPASHRLSAMVAADLVGYSGHMERDELGTLRAVKEIAADIVAPKARDYRGQVVNTAGDSFLLQFASTRDALRCAIEIQRTMALRNARLSPHRRLKFRIGINLGDVFFSGENVFGDGVNLAARLEEIASPGGICVSQAIREQNFEQSDFEFEDLGPQYLKNITRPVHAFAVRFAGAEFHDSVLRYQLRSILRLLRAIPKSWLPQIIGLAAIALVSGYVQYKLWTEKKQLQDAWAIVRQSDNPDELAAFISKFPETVEAEAAKNRLRQVMPGWLKQLARERDLATNQKEWAKSYEITKLMAAHDSAKAAISMCYHHFNGRGAKFDPAEVVRWCGLAAERGSGWAQFRLGTLYAAGVAVSQDLDRAAELCEQARSDDGPQQHLPPKSFCLAAISRLSGAAVPLTEASSDFPVAARASEPTFTHEQVETAEKYRYKYPHRARVLYEQLHRAGYDASYFFCEYYFEGPGMAYYAGSALKWCHAAAEINVWAEYRLGLIYALGLGISRDLVAAEKFCRRSGRSFDPAPIDFCLAVVEAMRRREI